MPEYISFLFISRKKVKRQISDSSPDVMLIDNEYIPSYTVFMLHHNELVKEKIQAALTRKKPRDFYDVYYLLRAQMINVSLRPLLRKVPAILDEEKINFKRELQTFLPRSHWPIIKDFKKNLLQEIRSYRL